MKNIKKFLAVCICLVLTTAVLYGCGSSSPAENTSQAAQENAPAKDFTDSSKVSAGTNGSAPSASAGTSAADTGASAPSGGSTQLITETEAKEIALSHAGVSEADAFFVHVRLDRDFFKTEYEVEFYSGNTEYDYDIDAVTGDILSYDYDAEYYDAAPGALPSGENFISSEQAKEAALSHAGLTAQDIQFIKADFDFDDGRAEYEIEFYYGMAEYSYSIDAVTGKIIGFEKDMD